MVENKENSIFFDDRSRSNYYLTNLVLLLYEDMMGWLQNKIEGIDFYYNWYKIVPFILFVIRIVHHKADIKSQEIIEKEIDIYIFNFKDQINYLNKFGSDELKKGVKDYDKEDLSAGVEHLYCEYLKFYNELIKLETDPFFPINDFFSQTLSTDDDRRNLNNSFQFLMEKFVFKKIKLYKA